jgi:hypothetical protein
LLEEYPDLAICRKSGEELLTHTARIDQWVERLIEEKKVLPDKPDPNIDTMFGLAIKAAKKFETVLIADLEKLTAYHPLQKGIYNTQLLVSQSDLAFTKDVQQRLTRIALEEIRESGKCLAFDCYTACGFHIVRSLEVVLHDYYVTMCKPSDPNKRLGMWAAYLSALYEVCKDEGTTLQKDQKAHVKKVCSLLQQIKDQNRNLIMHPETVLNEDDALTLFDIARSAVMAMSEQLPKKSSG